MPVKLTKEQRVYGAILAIAGLGLAVDRLLLESPLTGPGGAAAGEAPPDPAAPVADPARAAQPGPPSDLAQRLDALRGQGAGPDAMAEVLALPAAWFDGESAIGPDSGPTQHDAAPREYKLTAVAAGKAGVGGFAVVNKRRLSIGDTIDGMTLVEIRGRQAVFTAGSENIVLTMELPMKATRAEPGDSSPH